MSLSLAFGSYDISMSKLAWVAGKLSMKQYLLNRKLYKMFVFIVCWVDLLEPRQVCMCVLFTWNTCADVWRKQLSVQVCSMQLQLL